MGRGTYDEHHINARSIHPGVWGRSLNPRHRPCIIPDTKEGRPLDAPPSKHVALSRLRDPIRLHSHTWNGDVVAGAHADDQRLPGSVCTVTEIDGHPV
jgi:hypothetical protein